MTLLQKTLVVVMAVSRCRHSTITVLLNAARMLPSSVPIVVYHGKVNAGCMTSMIQSTPALTALQQSKRVTLKQHAGINAGNHIYTSQNWNNKLFTNVAFWENVRKYGAYALTVQHDTLICSHRPPPLANYIGGISFASPQASTLPIIYHLNGGLSVRNIDWTIKCIRNAKSSNNKGEDHYFNACSGGRFNVSILDAMAFSSDNGHTNCFDWAGQRRCPWGVHKPWVHASKSDYNELLTYCPEIATLKAGQRPWVQPPLGMPKVRVACALYTYHGNRHLVTESYEAWGKNCDHFLPYSDEHWEYAPGRWTIDTRLSGNKNTLWNDVRIMHADLADKLANKVIDFDFVTFGGDDTFWFIPRLRHYLQRLSTLTTSNSFGTRNVPANFYAEYLGEVADKLTDAPWVGGAGYVLNRYVIKKRMLAHCRPRVSSAEDVHTSQCLTKQGVRLRDTRDNLGRDRFCRSHPNARCGHHGTASDAVLLYHYVTGRKRANLGAYVPSREESDWSGDKTGHICSTARAQAAKMMYAIGKVEHMSVMPDGTPIEPLSGIGRHPIASVGCHLTQETGIFDISYLQISNYCTATPPPKAYFLDMGCAEYDEARAIASGLGSSIPLFETMYAKKACINFNMITAWEATPYPHWWDKVPLKKRSRIRFHNHKVDANAIRRLLPQFSRSDFVVVKLDIDHTETELSIMAVIKEFAYLIDELFFEYHFYFDGLNFGWGVNEHLKSTHNVSTAMRLMTELRQDGIRAHFWI